MIDMTSTVSETAAATEAPAEDTAEVTETAQAESTTEDATTAAPAEGTEQVTEDSTEGTTPAAPAQAEVKPPKPETPGILTLPGQVSIAPPMTGAGTFAYVIQRIAHPTSQSCLDAMRIVVTSAALPEDVWGVGRKVTLKGMKDKASFGTWRIVQRYEDGVLKVGVKADALRLVKTGLQYTIDPAKSLFYFLVSGTPYLSIDEVKQAKAVGQLAIRTAKEAQAAEAARLEAERAAQVAAAAEAAKSEDTLSEDLAASLEANGVEVPADPDAAVEAFEAEASEIAEEIIDELVEDGVIDADMVEGDDGEDDLDGDEDELDDDGDTDGETVDGDEPPPASEAIVAASDARGKHDRNRGNRRNAA